MLLGLGLVALQVRASCEGRAAVARERTFTVMSSEMALIRQHEVSEHLDDQPYETHVCNCAWP